MAKYAGPQGSPITDIMVNQARATRLAFTARGARRHSGNAGRATVATTSPGAAKANQPTTTGVVISRADGLDQAAAQLFRHSDSCIFPIRLCTSLFRRV